jgi:FKBP-type peptidyl-prolyl cis-trans isomerase FkpA
MSMVTRLSVALMLLCFVVAGCEEPTVIVPTTPPGTDPLAPPPPSEKDKAEAIGEQAPKSATSGASAETSKLEPAPATAKGETKTTKSGVKYETLSEGKGPEAKPGQEVHVDYTGTLTDGKEFDTSRKPGGKPFAFVLGAGGAILGWQEGICGMKVGERRKLTIPPNAGYGADGFGTTIPPNATLIFDVELKDIK